MAEQAPGVQLWPTDFEGWEDVVAPPPEERLVSDGGSVIVWQVKIGYKFGCSIWVDVAPHFSNAVEKSFQSEKNIVTANEGFGRWAMDPTRMEQTNTETKKVRAMRRVIVTNDVATAIRCERVHQAP